MAKSASKSGKNRKAAGMQSTSRKVAWLAQPAEHDYPSAASFLTLIARGARVEVLTALLSQAPMVHHAARTFWGRQGCRCCR
jgi:hypothetical protein